MNIRAKIFGGADGAVEEPLVQAKRPTAVAKSDSLENVNVVREEQRSSNSRLEARHRLINERAELTHNGRKHEVEVINLSGGGAMISCDFELGLWDEAHLHFGDNGSLECAVRWKRGNRVGLEFAHETRLDCSAGTQANLLRDVVTRNFPEIEFNIVADATPERDEAEKRIAQRHPFIWSAVLHHDYQSTNVRLRNISETGAMIQGDFALVVGNQLLFDLGESGSIFATVAWTFGDQAGLKFDEPYDLAQLARSRPDVAEAQRNVPTYSNRQEEGSPWDEHWNRLSLGEIRDELEGYLKR
jgi:hypothetical protein